MRGQKYSWCVFWGKGCMLQLSSLAHSVCQACIGGRRSRLVAGISADQCTPKSILAYSQAVNDTMYLVDFPGSAWVQPDYMGSIRIQLCFRPCNEENFLIP